MGFDDGTEYGIRQVYRDATSRGIDLGPMNIKDYIDQSKLRKDREAEFDNVFSVLD